MTRSYKVQLHIECGDQRDFLEHCMIAKNRLFNLYVCVQVGLLATANRLYGKGGLSKQKKKTRQHFYISAFEFEKIFNHTIRPSRTYPKWLDTIPQKTRKQAFRDADTAFKNMFQHGRGLPKFKGLGTKPSCYFIGSIHIERDRIKLPKIGWLRLSEFGYLPTDTQLVKREAHVTGCWVSEDAGKYFVSVQTNEQERIQPNLCARTMGIGIDLGIKQFATISDGQVFVNLTKTTYYQHLEHYKKRWERRFSRRIVSLKKHNHLRRLGNHTTHGIEKAREQMKKWRRKLRMVGENYIRQTTSRLVRKNPAYITIEDLNVTGMKANSKLAPALQKLGLYRFKAWLTWLCKKHCVELRIVPPYYPSTKLCSRCHQYNHQQFTNRLFDLGIRTFRCSNCNLELDRDMNAAINLVNSSQYRLINSIDD